LLVTLVVALRFAGQPVKHNWQAWRTRYATSEVAQWKRLRSACGRGEAAKAYGELGWWLAHFNMVTPQLTTTITQGVSDASTCIKLQQRLTSIDTQWDAQIGKYWA